MWFLYKLGLINPWLITKWGDETPGTSLEVSSAVREMEAIRLPRFGFGFMLLLVFLADLFAEKGILTFEFKVTFRAFFFLVLLIWILSMICESKFVRDLNVLNELFGEELTANTYNLNENTEWMVQKSKSILARRKTILKQKETKDIESPEASFARKKFKNAHKIFVKFQLCDKDQQYYFSLPDEY